MGTFKEIRSLYQINFSFWLLFGFVCINHQLFNTFYAHYFCPCWCYVWVKTLYKTLFPHLLFIYAFILLFYSFLQRFLSSVLVCFSLLTLLHSLFCFSRPSSICCLFLYQIWYPSSMVVCRSKTKTCYSVISSGTRKRFAYSSSRDCVVPVVAV